MYAPLLLLALSLSASPPPKVAVLSLSSGEGVQAQTAESFTDALAAELRKLGTAQVVTHRELAAVLSVERQKELLGCSSASCITELAGALDVQQLVLGSLSRLGESWLLQLQRVDAQSGAVLAHASRRKKGGSIDDLLDDLPAMAKELFGGAAAQQPAAAVTSPPEPAKLLPAPEPVPAAPALPPPYADVPQPEPVADPSKLLVLTDGKGHYLAVVPFQSVSGHFFAGDAKALYRQRVFGGGSSGKESFDLVFWEPRARAPWQASFDFRDGKYHLQCGDSKVAFSPLPAPKAKAFLKKARLHGVRWQRQAYALARDDDGNWFYVDRARLPEDSHDFRLYLGTQGELRTYQVQVLAHDRAGDLFRAGGGKLKLKLAEQQAEWSAGDARTKLTVVPVEDSVRQIYGPLGAYTGMPLGTACDPFF